MKTIPSSKKKKKLRSKKKIHSSKISHLKRKRRKKNLFYQVILSVFLGGLLAGCVGSFFIEIGTVKGFGMIPTLRDGDRVLVEKKQAFKRFDLVFFSTGNGKEQVRRIIGMPGETIRYESDTLYINGQPIEEKFLISEINESQKGGKNYTENFSKTTELRVPTGYYFVLGDNRPYATDSRHYGLISEKKIQGVLIFQFSPFTKIQAL